MLLAISMRVTHNASYPEPRDSLAHDWPTWLDAVGHQPVMLPNRLRDPKAYLRAARVDGLILTGGDSIFPSPDDGEEAQARVVTERAAIDMAIEDNLPILGICRGLQMLNHFFGGEIIDDIATQLPDAQSHVARNHSVELLAPFAEFNEGSRLAVNSYHDQGVVLQGLASDLKVFALSDDGLVEGLVHSELPILAVQWHPERVNPGRDLVMALLGRFLAEGAFWRGWMK